MFTELGRVIQEAYETLAVAESKLGCDTVPTSLMVSLLNTIGSQVKITERQVYESLGHGK